MRTQVEAGPCQDLGDLHLAQHWAEGFELLDDVPHELRELVDRLGQLDQADGVGLLNPLFFIGVPLGIYWLVLAINGLRRERAAWAGRDHGTWP